MRTNYARNLKSENLERDNKGERKYSNFNAYKMQVSCGKWLWKFEVYQSGGTVHRTPLIKNESAVSAMDSPGDDGGLASPRRGEAKTNRRAPFV